MTTYPSHDRSMLPAPPWKPEQVDDWEQAHGHDVRLDCALEGCERLIADYEAAVDALERLTNLQDTKDYSAAWDAGRAALARLREKVPA